MKNVSDKKGWYNVEVKIRMESSPIILINIKNDTKAGK